MALICGLKLEHDGGLALVESTRSGARLVAATEVEKHDNRWRHDALFDAGLIEHLFEQLGHRVDEVNRFVVDGWVDEAVNKGFEVWTADRRELIRTAPYRQSDDSTPVLHCYQPDSLLTLAGKPRSYESYRHVESHLASAYLTSPAAAERLPALVLVWDASSFPVVYLVDPVQRTVHYRGWLFGILGGVYEFFSRNVPPFVPDPQWDEVKKWHFQMSNCGKVMAYAGLGTVSEPLVREIRRALAALDGRWDVFGTDLFFQEIEPTIRRIDLDDASVLASFHEALARLLVERLADAVKPLNGRVRTLCFAGGSALNIKWNSAIRDSGLFDTVWVPPFPNDSGAAIGTACASLMHRGAFGPLEWSVYGGPPMRATQLRPGWHGEKCSVDELGALLATTEEPVIVLSDRAELGPRALGHRSILASPRQERMKGILNQMKGRESYRPVAPMCLEENSSDIFNPGGADPFMLFDHHIRPEWVDRIPAVRHVDGTARLQTVNDRTAPLATAIVRAFAARSGIPVLCNTSANHNGRGFFPDVGSAMEWGRTAYIWSDGILYSSANTGPDTWGAAPDELPYGRQIGATEPEWKDTWKRKAAERGLR
jgi:carbamoyltransferase